MGRLTTEDTCDSLFADVRRFKAAFANCKELSRTHWGLYTNVVGVRNG